MSTNYISQITASNGTTYDIQEGVTTRIFRATCSTAASIAAKVATLDDATGYSLAAGVRVAVTFTYGNSADTPTLNINSGGAKTIVIPTTTISANYSSDKSYTSWGQYETIIFTYNGTYWITSGSSYMLYKAASTKTSLSDYTDGSNYSLYIPFTNLSGSNGTLTSAHVSPNFKIVDSQTNHLATLNLGNDLGSDETTYRRGALRLYSQTGKYIELETKDTLSTNGTIYFPDYINNNATIATTEDIPSITLNGNSTTSPSFYAPTSVGSSGQYLKSNGSGAPSWTNFPTIPSITLNGNSNTSPSFYAPTSAGTSGYVLKSNGSGAPTWTSATLTDTQVKSTAVTAATTNYLVGSTTSTTITGELSKHASGVLYTTADSGTSGYTQLRLGNTTATTSAGGKEGQIRLYGTNATYYLDLKPGAIASSNKTITFPNATGTVALTSDLTDKIDSAGTGLSKTGTQLNHSNSVTSTNVQAVYPIKIDSTGHISAYGSAVTIPTITDTYSSTSSNGMSGKAVASALSNSGFTSNTGTVTSVQVQASSPLQSSTSTAQSSTLSTTISFVSQSANTVLAGPSSGSAAAPSFRSLVADDIPELLSSATITKWNAILGV